MKVMDMIHGYVCKDKDMKINVTCALHLTKYSCQLLILSTEIKDKDKDMGCALFLRGNAI